MNGWRKMSMEKKINKNYHTIIMFSFLYLCYRIIVMFVLVDGGDRGVICVLSHHYTDIILFN